VLLDLLCGMLPWADAATAKDKAAVKSLKHDHVTTDPSKIIAWVAERVRAAEAAAPVPVPEAQSSFPLRAQENVTR